MRRLTEDQKKTVEENLGLAYAIANKMRRDDLPKADKMQASVLGLIKATLSRDAAKGTLGTHAKKTVKKAVLVAGTREHVIYVPIKVFHKSKNVSPERREKMLALAIKSRRMNWIGDETTSKGGGGSINWFRRAETALSRDSEDPATVAAHAEWLALLKDEIRDAMSELKPKQQAAIAGFLDGEEQWETADRLGCTRQNITELKKSAFAKMRKRLSRFVA